MSYTNELIKIAAGLPKIHGPLRASSSEMLSNATKRLNKSGKVPFKRGPHAVPQYPKHVTRNGKRMMSSEPLRDSLIKQLG